MVMSDGGRTSLVSCSGQSVVAATLNGHVCCCIFTHGVAGALMKLPITHSKGELTKSQLPCISMALTCLALHPHGQDRSIHV